MAIISSSNSTWLGPAVFLRPQQLEGRDTGEWVRYALVPASALSGRIEVSGEGVVSVANAYEIAIDLDGAGDVLPRVEINGEEISLELRGNIIGGPAAVQYYSARTDGGQIFSGILGYARVSVFLSGPDGPGRELCTRDIPTQLPGTQETEVRRAELMLSALMDSCNDRVANLMFAGVSDDKERFSIVEGGFKGSAGRSLSTYLRVVNDTLTGLDSVVGPLSAQSRTVVRREPVVVRGEAVRTFGRSESEWIARNANVLHQVRIPTAISVDGKDYLPRYIRTSQLQRRRDSYENRTILAFVRHLERNLAAVSSMLSHQIDESSRIKRLVNDSHWDGYVVSSIIVEESKTRMATLSRERVESLRHRASSLSQILGRMWPDVDVAPFLSRPRRTRTFQEIGPYIKAFGLIGRYLDEGDYTLEREELVLHTLRLDRIYEYYALSVMIGQLISAGFEPDNSHEQPIGSFTYSMQADVFENECRVANTYHLRRAGQRIDLYYQPVLYGDGREENGITLHRTTGAVPFSDDSCKRSAYWTPDYLLVLHETGSREGRTIILDAKYSRVNTMIGRCHGTQYSGQDVLKSRFGDCMRKYVLETTDSASCHQPALWLLCGREDVDTVITYQGSRWMKLNGSRVFPSGVISLGPNANDFKEIISMLGLTYPTAATDMHAGGNVPEVSVHGHNVESSEIEHRISEDGRSLEDASAGEKPVNEHPCMDARDESGTTNRDYMTCVETLYSFSATREALFKNIKFLSHAILREKEPKGHEKKLYVPTELGGNRLYVFKAWNPSTLRQLQRWAESVHVDDTIVGGGR